MALVLSSRSCFPHGDPSCCQLGFREAAKHVHDHYLKLRADLLIIAQAIRVSTSSFDEAIPKITCCLREDPLSANWPTPRFSCKAVTPPWVSLVHQMRLMVVPYFASLVLHNLTLITGSRFPQMNAEQKFLDNLV